jgi:hypothetical protein
MYSSRSAAAGTYAAGISVITSAPSTFVHEAATAVSTRQ